MFCIKIFPKTDYLAVKWQLMLNLGMVIRRHLRYCSTFIFKCVFVLGYLVKCNAFIEPFLIGDFEIQAFDMISFLEQIKINLFEINDDFSDGTFL